MGKYKNLPWQLIHTLLNLICFVHITQLFKMEMFDRPDDSTVDEPFDPAIDHFRILSQYSPQKKLVKICYEN